MSSRLVPVSVLVACLACAYACEKSKQKTPVTKSPETKPPATDATKRSATDATKKPATKKKPAKTSGYHRKGWPTNWGAYCSKTTDCGWDNSCDAKACVERDKSGAKDECEETAPLPGACECIEHRCTLRPRTPPKPTTATCSGDHECGVDPATAKCHVVANPTKRRIRRPIRVEGPICTCDATTKRCRSSWSPKVSCTTWRDCGWSDKPVRRPIRANPKRTKKIRACKDQSFDSRCVPDQRGGGKHCRIVAWRC